MKNDQIDHIRLLLDELEVDLESGRTLDERAFSGLELPYLIQDIVDYLQPLLEPYQVAVYWYLFRHSIAENGSQLIRASTRGLREGVLKPPSSELISFGQVQKTLSGLEKLGVIRKEGDPNRDGTLYRVLVPEEIEACRARKDSLSLVSAAIEIYENEVDYYNVRENRLKVYERDDYICQYCGKQLTHWTVSLDHVRPVVDGGDNSFENLKTSCFECNSRKNKKPLGDFLADRP